MATNKVYCSYQEIVDLNTEADKVSVIGIHTPVGDTPHKMFSGFYDQFKKYKYLGSDIALVPAARLPVDPLGVSYDAEEPTIDPRDVLNPLMFHGCHGEDMGAILNKLYTSGIGAETSLVSEFDADAVSIFNFENSPEYSGDSSLDNNLLENLYYKALTDNSWRKANPQRGFRKSNLRPLIYKVAATHQIMPNDSMPRTDLAGMEDMGIDSMPDMEFEAQGGGDLIGSFSFTNHHYKMTYNLLTNRLTSLGWMDTRNVLGTTITPNFSKTYTELVTENKGNNIDTTLANLLDQNSYRATLPRIFMGMILLPPAYKTKQYFRMVINHKFAFAGFRSMSFQNTNLNESTPAYFNEDFQRGEPEPPGPGPEPPSPSTVFGYYGVAVHNDMNVPVTVTPYLNNVADSTLATEIPVDGTHTWYSGSFSYIVNGDTVKFGCRLNNRTYYSRVFDVDLEDRQDEVLIEISDFE